jgi:tetratricopeptide (TPR) repeat protein
MLTIIPLIIIIIALAVIIVIAARHLPEVAAINVGAIPEEREAHLKKSLLENRLMRKLDAAFNTVSNVFAPLSRAMSSWQERFTKLWQHLERSYRLRTVSPLPDTSAKQDARAQELLDAAKKAAAEGLLAEAETAFLEAIKINPASFAAYQGLGNIYIKKDSWKDAREVFEYMTKTWPQNDEAFALLALVEEVDGSPEKAKDLYLHALSINNKALDYHLNLAEVYVQLDDKEKALSTLQKAQGLEPNNPKVLDQLLQASILLGNKILAEEVLEKIKKVNPEHGKLAELEEKVKALS